MDGKGPLWARNQLMYTMTYIILYVSHKLVINRWDAALGGTEG